MKIFISGITGTGMGPLALMAKDAGAEVFGSDLSDSPISSELKKAQIDFKVGPQTADFISSLQDIDWFIYTSSLPADHPELAYAKSHNIKISKRDELINFLIQKFNLKLIAVAGTHGKTTTTAILIWTFRQLGIPISYLVGSNLGFAPSGHYDQNAQFFVYEADEYDRNFLTFSPWLSLIMAVSYDHSDIYPTRLDYENAFNQFRSQSQNIIEMPTTPDLRINLAGYFRRIDATSALKAVEISVENFDKNKEDILNKAILAINSFPGVGRRFEKIFKNVYSDYAHHPEEIIATLNLAKEEAIKHKLKGVVAVYEPHQNSRQHEVFDLYQKAFNDANYLFWLPTYLTRENPNLSVIQPAEFISSLTSPKLIAKPAKPDQVLANTLKTLSQDHLVVLMSAGPADKWFRLIW